MKARTSWSREKMMCDPPVSKQKPLTLRERQSPPMDGSASSTTTSSPASRRKRARVRPVSPPPRIAVFTPVYFTAVLYMFDRMPGQGERLKG